MEETKIPSALSYKGIKGKIKWVDDHLESVIGIIGVTLMMFFLCWQTLYRYIVTNFTAGGGGAAWAEEFARYIFIAITYLVIPVAIKRRSLVRIDMVYDHLPKRFQGISWITVDLFCLGLAVVELTQSWNNLITAHNYGTIIGSYSIPYTIPYCVIPIAFILIIIRVVQDMIKQVRECGAVNTLLGLAVAVVLLLPVLLKIPMNAAAYLFLYFAVLLILGVPIAFSLGIAGICCIFGAGSLPITYLGQIAFGSINSTGIMCIPLFILAGNFMGEGGLSNRLFSIADEIFGGLHGGMAMATVATCMIFAAMSGSGPATVAAIGALTIPAMVKRGYGREFSTAVVACAGAIGVLIPPSNPLVMYGISGGVSIAKLFAAGVVPGILVGLGLMVVSFFWSKKAGWKGGENKRNWKHIGKLVWEAKWALLVPVIILGGIYSGLFTPTEAAAVAALYGLIVGCFVYKGINRTNILPCLQESAITSSTCVSLLAFATIFGNIMTMERIPNAVASFITGLTTDKILILLIINLLLLLVGMFMDTLAAIIILTPILLPIVTPMGVNPIHFGVIMVVNLAIGFVTPPVGVNLFVASGVGQVKLEVLAKKVLPLLVSMIVVLLLITYIPALCLALPSITK